MKTYITFILIFISFGIYAQNDVQFDIVHATEYSCDDGSIETTVNGGIPPYEFSWTYDNGNELVSFSTSQNIYQLRNYQYCVTITDALCGEFTDCMDVHCCPSIPEASINHYCSDVEMGSISYGSYNGWYSISWYGPNGLIDQDDLSIENLEPGLYHAKFSDYFGECSEIKYFTIEDESVDITVVNFQNPDCAWVGDNGTITISVDGDYQEILWNYFDSNTGYIGSLLDMGLTVNNLGAIEVILRVVRDGCTTRKYFRMHCCYEDNKGDRPDRLLPVPEFTEVNINWVSSEGECDGSISFDTNQPNHVQVVTSIIQMPDNVQVSDLDNLCEGEYCITINNGCDATTECFEIEVCPNININGQVNVACNGYDVGSIELDISGGNEPYAFAWSNNLSSKNISNLSSGSYTVTVSDFYGCEEEMTFYVGLEQADRNICEVICGNQNLDYGPLVPVPNANDCRSYDLVCSRDGHSVQTNIPAESIYTLEGCNLLEVNSVTKETCAFYPGHSCNICFFDILPQQFGQDLVLSCDLQYCYFNTINAFTVTNIDDHNNPVVSTQINEDEKFVQLFNNCISSEDPIWTQQMKSSQLPPMAQTSCANFLPPGFIFDDVSGFFGNACSGFSENPDNSFVNKLEKNDEGSHIINNLSSFFTEDSKKEVLIVNIDSICDSGLAIMFNSEIEFTTNVLIKDQDENIIRALPIQIYEGSNKIFLRRGIYDSIDLGIFTLEIKTQNGKLFKKEIAWNCDISKRELVKDNIKIYPNPFTSLVHISIDESIKSKDNIHIEVYNNLGEKLIHRVFSDNPKALSSTLNLRNLSSGIYILRVVNEYGEILVNKNIVKIESD